MFCILCAIVGGLVITIILIIYFTFPFIGIGIALFPDLGFVLSLIGGLSAIGAGTLDIIKGKRTSHSN